MSDEPVVPPDETDLQFERAEYAQGQPAGTACSQCAQPLSDSYYQINDQPVCERCRFDIEMAERQGARGGFGRFVRATVFGGLAAIVGGALWFGIRALTGYDLGLIAIVVGLMVGAAVRAGARGRGGWRYQTLAVFLTYTAVAATFVPIVIQGLKEAQKKEPAPAAVSAEATAAPAAPAAVTPVAASSSPEAGSGGAAPGPVVFVLGAILVLVLAYVSPFFLLAEGVNGLIGLAIVGFALYEAWKLNKRVPRVITGPYRLAQAATAPAPAPADAPH